MVSSSCLHSVLDTAVNGIIIIDDNATIQVYNRACENLFGYTSEEAVGQNVNLLMPDAVAAQHDGYIQKYLKSGDARVVGIGREVVARHKDGTQIPVELSVGEAQTESGHQFIGVLKDLRATKEYEERLRVLQSNLVTMTRVNALDEMGAAIAHEVNQPLTALMLYLQTGARRARATEQPDEAMITLMDKAVTEAARAGQIIQRMRNFVERQAPQCIGTGLATLIDDCLELVRVGQETDDVEFVSSFVDYNYHLELDSVQIQQILVNLIRNAGEAVKDRPVKKVVVSVERDEENVFVKVTDTGAGLDEDVVSHLFKAFTGTKRRGLGIGLAISRSIAQNHGGDLTVEPYEEGKGATFTLRLPVNSKATSKAEAVV
ncbi:Sensor protein FixL [Pseudovibrio axinellae]|uniref:Sensor protein FixL n=1 Tax=Pseudovibrio axinellae TaxID=989403 RepID=A0A165YL19_9HYPH|nr:PAS domain-containing sensor histidine kinase [Pseudovibrio axinellae]KZL18939.1 Sensor protein FixL [Pseudovibrio axinellae]SEP86960.1 PAS/PAC sensor signal transduction histidine kinase [Pseudovibrio axinellae]